MPAPTIRTSGSPLGTAPGDEIHRRGGARVRDVREMLAHGRKPLLPPGHVDDDRSEYHEVVHGGAVLEEERPSTRPQDPLRFGEQLLAVSAVRHLVRAAAEADGVAARSPDRERGSAGSMRLHPR